MTHSDDLQKIIDESSDEISKNFFDWVEGTLSATDWRKFETAIESGNFSQAADLIEWSDYAPGAVVGAALGAAAIRNGEYIEEITGLKYAFDIKDPNSLAWIESHGAELVKDIGEGAERDLREVIYRGYFSGYTPRQQAEYIKGLIGLDERRIEQVNSYARALADRGFSPAEITKKATQRAQKKLNDRAKTIAVNEASEASGRGTYFSTKDAYNRGVLGPEWEGFRIVTWDERLCPKCAPLAGEARQLPDGVYPSTGDTIAKIHVLCRCQEGLRKVGSDRGKTNPNQKEADMTGKKRESMKSSIDVVFEAKGLKETETSIIVPTVPIVEGVFDGHGFPAFRNFDEFSEDAKWLDGLTIVTNHEPLDPDARRIGQLRTPTPDAGMRRVKASTEFYKDNITPKELDALRSKKPLHGSLGYSCYMEYAPGDWNGKHYEAKEHGPYVFYEYSLVRNGVVTPEDGAGFNIEDSKVRAMEPVQPCTEDGKPGFRWGKEGKCYTYEPGDKDGMAAAKKKAALQGAAIGESQSQSPAQRADKRGETMIGDESSPGLEPEVKETIADLQNRIAEQDTKIADLETKVQAVTEEKDQIKETLVAERELQALEKFTNSLKQGKRDKAADLFKEYSEAATESPIQGLLWRQDHEDLFLTKTEATQLKGQPVVEGAPEKTFDLAEEQRKLFKY